MKAEIGFCRRPLLGALAVGMLVMGTSAFGQEIFFTPIRTAVIGSPTGTLGTPVSATFNGTCWEYTADAGGFELDIDLRAGGWGNAMGSPTLGAIQATVLPGGYNNGVGSILVPKGCVMLGDTLAAYQA
ncbi:MAG: hypothetical protein IH897_14090, partial [Planctomycetes bacterium]|nr:hypothetical protein [Planctomycetota bacterium]